MYRERERKRESHRGVGIYRARGGARMSLKRMEGTMKEGGSGAAGRKQEAGWLWPRGEVGETARRGSREKETDGGGGGGINARTGPRTQTPYRQPAYFVIRQV